MPMISNLARRLKETGHKLTPARLAVIEVLEACPDHLNHNQILAAARKLYPKLSRATVYRTMDLLVELKLVRPLYLNDPTQRFVSAKGGHHHLICAKCDQVVEFDYCAAGQLAQQLAESYNFQIYSHLLEFQGLCETCR